ncbi:MAG: hypothetical protein WDA16_08155 [Candidatus Thermoplasmatota archaeon]
MRFLARVLLGAFLGLVTLGGLHFAITRWWISGIAGALVGVLGFLLTFFVWTADRPDVGYEQVLFDGANSAVSVILAVILVAGGFGISLAGKSSTPQDPAVVEMNAQHDKLTRIYNDVTASKLDAVSLRSARADVQAAQASLAKLPTSERLALLTKAAAAEVTSLDEYEKCGTKLCQNATLALLDAKGPLNKYAG